MPGHYAAKSDWAFERVHRAWGTAKGSKDGELARELALTLGAIQATVDVIGSGRRFRCEYASGDRPDTPRSYTSFDERLVRVSAQAVLDRAIARARGIDITIGWALHEGSHIEYSGGLFETLRTEPRVEPLSIASNLGNLLEDTRIEHLTSVEYPGFADYFDEANDYLWEIQRKYAPTKWGVPSAAALATRKEWEQKAKAKDAGYKAWSSAELSAKLSAIVLAVKWPRQYEPIARADPVLSAEFDWWNAWRERYLGGGTFRTLVEEALARLRLDPKTDKELNSISKREREEEKRMASLMKAIEKAIDDMAKNGMPATCPSGEVVELPPELAEKVNKLVREKLRVDAPLTHITTGGGAKPQLIILKPEETHESRRYFRKPDASLVARMRHAFHFRPVARQFATRMMRSGAVDEQQLWRVGAGDFRVFSRKTVESRPDTSVTLLIDQSGSMGVSKLQSASDAAMVMHACLRDMPGVTLRIRSHTADASDCGYGNAVIYRIWEHGDPVTRLGLMQALEHSDNADGYAIEWCAKELLDTSRQQEQRLLIVLSDGYPAAHCYRTWGGGEDHVHEVTEWARRQGVAVVQVAIDQSLRPDAQGKMFRRWVQFEGLDKLPSQVTRLLSEAL